MNNNKEKDKVGFSPQVTDSLNAVLNHLVSEKVKFSVNENGSLVVKIVSANLDAWHETDKVVELEMTHDSLTVLVDEMRENRSHYTEPDYDDSWEVIGDTGIKGLID